MSFPSDVILGDKYRDSQTGFEGIATAIYFFQYGCERVQLEQFDKKTSDIRAITFDAPRLISAKTGKAPVVTKTGGPGNAGEGRPRVKAHASIASR